MLLMEYGLTVSTLIVIFFAGTSVSEEKCPYHDVVTKDGHVNRDLCSLKENCPDRQFVENCVIECHISGKTGTLTCSRKSGNLVVTSEPPSFLDLLVSTTTNAPPSTSTVTSTATTPTETPTTTPIVNSTANSSYVIFTASALPSTTHRLKKSSNTVWIICGTVLGAVVIVAVVLVSVLAWYRHSRVKILPITPSKPRTKQNEPI